MDFTLFVPVKVEITVPYFLGRRLRMQDEHQAATHLLLAFSYD